mgnify:CR=1 FL=1
MCGALCGDWGGSTGKRKKHKKNKLVIYYRPLPSFSPPPVDLSAHDLSAYSIHYGVDITTRIRPLGVLHFKNLASQSRQGKHEAEQLAQQILASDKIEAKQNHLDPEKCSVVLGNWTANGWIEWARTTEYIKPPNNWYERIIYWIKLLATPSPGAF